MRFLFIFAIFLSGSVLANEVSINELESEFSSILGCDNNIRAALCFDSIQKNGDDYIIKIVINSHEHVDYVQEKHVQFLAKESNKLYSMFNKRTAGFLSKSYELVGFNYALTKDIEDMFVLVISFAFNNQTVVVIRDANDTAYISYESGLNVIDRLQKNRDSMSRNAITYFDPENAGKYHTLLRDVYLSSIREVVEYKAKKDMATGEVTKLGPTINTGKHVKVRKLIGHQVVYFNLGG